LTSRLAFLAMCLPALALQACVPIPTAPDIERHQEFLVGPQDLQPGAGVMLVAAHGEIDKLVACAGERLKGIRPSIRFVSGTSLRDEVFPWLDPGIVPTDPQSRAAYLTNARLLEKLRSYGARYLVWIDGTSYRMESGGAGAPVAFIMKHDELRAAIVDLEDERFVGDLAAVASGTDMISLVPVMLMTRTFPAACREFATGLAEFFGTVDTLAGR
jgi:hypothetical protein